MTQYVMTEGGGWGQTVIKQVKKERGGGRLQCGMAVMCKADLILVEGHRVPSGSPHQLGGKKKSQHCFLWAAI